jgi:hypothetical protein
MVGASLNATLFAVTETVPVVATVAVARNAIEPAASVEGARGVTAAATPETRTAMEPAGTPASA